MTLTALNHPLLGVALLIGGSALLPFLAPGSELLIGLAIVGALAAVWSWQAQNRWYAALAGVFIWSLIGFYLRGVGESIGAILSLSVLIAVSTSLSLWQLESTDARTVLLSLAAGIVVLELFLMLLFWPINFPSRALLLTMVYGLMLEVLDLARNRSLSLRALLPSLGVSALLTYTVVVTADWFGF